MNPTTRYAWHFLDERLPKRFWDKVSPCPMSGCWLFVGATTSHGYGNYRHEGRMEISHRVSYSALVGPIDAGLQLDHLCRVRCCVNPAHLEPVTNAVNTLRGESPRLASERNIAAALARTHCNRGHVLTPDNTISRGRSRSCRACTNVRKRGYRVAGAIDRGLVMP